MRKRQIRCYAAFAEVNGIYNYEVYYTIEEGWSKFTLATCINCSELFVIDWENPKTHNLNLKQIAANHTCPKCSLALKDTLKPYPKFFRTLDGEIGSFTPSHAIPDDAESLVIEVWEILPTLAQN